MFSCRERSWNQTTMRSTDRFHVAREHSSVERDTRAMSSAYLRSVLLLQVMLLVSMERRTVMSLLLALGPSDPFEVSNP